LDQVRAYFRAVEARLASGATLTTPDLAAEAAALAHPYVPTARRLGEITGLMHNALASDPSQPDFAPEPITAADVTRWEGTITALTRQVIANVRAQLAAYPPATGEQLAWVGAHEADYLGLIGTLAALQEEAVYKTRYHGDYHLGQVLKTGDDFIVLDFEGEPARPLAERRARHSPLKDVAGMLRSFNYAAYAVLFEAQARAADPAQRHALAAWATAWEEVARGAFLEGYFSAARQHTGAPYLPATPAVLQQVLAVFELEKAFYELNYEFNNRPTWVPIPLKGLLRVLAQD
jgi:maltose alpha-D-glucosyltransferase/alpha-amylase